MLHHFKPDDLNAIFTAHNEILNSFRKNHAHLEHALYRPDYYNNRPSNGMCALLIIIKNGILKILVSILDNEKIDFFIYQVGKLDPSSVSVLEDETFDSLIL
jgi:hypothetical protein